MAALMNHYISTAQTYLSHLPLLKRALLLSFLFWAPFLAYNSGYCYLHSAFVDNSQTSIWYSLWWYLREYGPWLPMTPVLLLGLSITYKRKQWVSLSLFTLGIFCVALAYRVALDLHQSSGAQIFSSLIYYSPKQLLLLLILLVLWVTMTRLADKPSMEVESDQEKPFPTELQTLTVDSGTEKVHLPINKIEHICAAGNYADVVCGTDTYVLRATMKELEAELGPFGFVRIHRSYLVNSTAVESRPAMDQIKIRGDLMLPIGQRYLKNLLKIKNL